MPNGKRTNVKDVLAQLKEAREGGVSRIDQLDLERNEDASLRYDTLDEAQYKDHLERVKRQDEAFLVDDEGFGYLEDDDHEPLLATKRRSKKRPAVEKKVAAVSKKLALETKGPKADDTKKKTQTLVDVVQKAPSCGGNVCEKKSTSSSDVFLSKLLHDIELKETSDENDGSENCPKSCDAQRSQTREQHDEEPSTLFDLLCNIGEQDIAEKGTSEPPAAVAPSAHEVADQGGLEELQEDVREKVQQSEDVQQTTPTDSDILPFFFLDADDSSDLQGVVYLFGKILKQNASNEFVSCCVRIQSAERSVYFIPKEGVSPKSDPHLESLEKAATENHEKRTALMTYLEDKMGSLKEEVTAVLKARGIKHVTKMKIVQRNYAFDYPPIPHDLQYVLKVTLPARGAQVPVNMTGKTFQAVLAAKQSLLESVLLRRKIMGPSWIAVRKPTFVSQEDQRSWCAVEVNIESHKDLLTSHSDVHNRSLPKLKIMALHLRAVYDHHSGGHEVAMATTATLSGVPCDHTLSEKEWHRVQTLQQFHALAKYKKQPWPPGFEGEVKTMNQTQIGKAHGGRLIVLNDSERSLLMCLLERIQESDPDVILGHDISNIDLDLLLHRLQHNKVEDWSRIGRLKRRKYPFFSGGRVSALVAITGRLLCDTCIFAHEHLREVDFSLTTLAKTQFNERRHDVTSQRLIEAFSDKKALIECVECVKNDAMLTLRLVFHLSILPLTKQLTNLTGSTWNKTLQGQTAQRINMLLMHEFHNRKFLLPEKKPFSREATGGALPNGHDTKRAGPQYEGGLVLDPKSGLYDSMVLLLDFNSLYPSIIREFGLCFTTVDRSKTEVVLPTSAASVNAPLPTVITGLINSRQQVKQLIAREKDPLVLKQRRIREQALKLTANSMYGCLGFAGSRFFCKKLAELVTSQGRAILQKTAERVEHQLGYEVVYGDTDSIMIKTESHDFNEVLHTVADKIKKAINGEYKYLRLDVDGIFQPLLLLKKKKYAAMKLSFKDGKLIKQREDKGLDIVRRDWSGIAKKVGHQVLDEILSEKPFDQFIHAIHEHLRKIRLQMDRGEVPLAEFEIVKQLAKHPEDYADAKSQPHVQVALRRKQQGHRDGILPGQAVPYIICESLMNPSNSRSYAERAYHPDEVKSNPEDLSVDISFYLSNQIHPVVSRLCEPIKGTNERRLAECLGLDGARYHSRPETATAGPAAQKHSIQHLEKWKALVFTIDGRSFQFPGIEAILKRDAPLNNALMPHQDLPNSNFTAAQIMNQTMLQVRQVLAEYYDGQCKMEDDDSGGEENVTKVPHYATDERRQPWTRVISEKQLYYQLTHWLRQLDFDGAFRKVNGAEGTEAGREWDGLREQLLPAFQKLQEIREMCDFGIIDFEELLLLNPQSADKQP